MTAAQHTAEPRPEQPQAMSRHPWWALISLLIGLSMIIIDGSVVNVLLPDMARDLELSSTDVLWVNSIYSLIFASLLIPIGLVADKFGRRRLFATGAVIFLLGSLGAGASTGPEMLIGFRAVQAVGASMMLPSSIAIINVMFVGKARAAAFGLWGAVFGGAAALGPLLGGWLTQDYSWRWAFYINVPVAIIALIMLFRFVPESKVETEVGFDPVGILMSVLGLALVVFGLIEGDQYGWWRAITTFKVGPIELQAGGISVVPVSLVVGVGLLCGLYAWTRHRSKAGRSTLIDLELFGIRRYGYGNIVALVVSLGEFGILFVLPLWLQSVVGLDPLASGVILTALAVGAFISAGAARHLAASIGPTRVVRVGMLLEIVGILGVAFVMRPTSNGWWLIVPLVVYGLGLGLASAQLTSVVLEDVPPEVSGRASAMTSTFRQLGTAMGSAILGSILFAGLGAFMNTELNTVGNLPRDQQVQLVDEVKGSAGQAIIKLETIPQLAPEVKAAKDGYTESARLTALMAAVFVFFGFLVSLGLPKDDLGATQGESADEDVESVPETA